MSDLRAPSEKDLKDHWKAGREARRLKRIRRMAHRFGEERDRLLEDIARNESAAISPFARRPRMGDA